MMPGTLAEVKMLKDPGGDHSGCCVRNFDDRTPSGLERTLVETTGVVASGISMIGHPLVQRGQNDPPKLKTFALSG
jgi:hypothetical protein